MLIRVARWRSRPPWLDWFTYMEVTKIRNLTNHWSLSTEKNFRSSALINTILMTHTRWNISHLYLQLAIKSHSLTCVHKKADQTTSISDMSWIQGKPVIGKMRWLTCCQIFWNFNLTFVLLKLVEFHQNMKKINFLSLWYCKSFAFNIS